MNSFSQMKNLLIVAAFLTPLAACQSQYEKVDDRQQAKELINQNRFEEAMALLGKLHAENPADGEVTLLLASTHAGIAGLNIVSSWKMFEPMVFGKKQKSDSDLNLTEDPAPATDAQTEKSGDFEKETYKFLSALALDFNILGRMPEIDLAGRSEVNEGLVLLSSVPADNSEYGRSRLYGAFLNLFQFSGVLRDSFPNIEKDKDYDLQSVVCEFNPTLFFQNLDLSLKYMQGAVTNVRQAADVIKLRKEIKLESVERNLSRLSELKATGDARMGEAIAVKSAFSQTICTKK